jgi:tRNA G18 (ribose-2'-O)-methylase SpoU
MKDATKNKEIVIVLPDIRSVLNVGSIFRTADATAVSKIYLCGYTAAPVDRFGRNREDLHKAALGAEKTVLWEQNEDTRATVQKLKEDGYTVIAVEQVESSVSYDSFDYNAYEKIALIFGNEVDGVQGEILEFADTVVELPMLGEKESLNVSVSAGVILYHLRASGF